MKHCEKCRLEKHLSFLKIKKMGVAGAILMVLHILFHVIECLILPSILVAFGGHLTEESAVAIDKTETLILEERTGRFDEEESLTECRNWLDMSLTQVERNSNDFIVANFTKSPCRLMPLQGE